MTNQEFKLLKASAKQDLIAIKDGNVFNVNGDVSIDIPTQCTAEAYISAKEVSNILKGYKAKEFDFEDQGGTIAVLIDKDSIKLKYDGFKQRRMSPEPDNTVKTDDNFKTVKFNYAEVLKAIQFTSDLKIREMLQCVHIKNNTIYSSDGYSLYKFKFDYNIDNVTIPRALEPIIKFYNKDQNPLQIFTCDNGYIYYTIGIATVRFYKQSIPNFEAITKDKAVTEVGNVTIKEGMFNRLSVDPLIIEGEAKFIRITFNEDTEELVLSNESMVESHKVERYNTNLELKSKVYISIRKMSNFVKNILGKRSEQRFDMSILGEGRGMMLRLIDGNLECLHMLIDLKD